ncbi:MAG: CoA-binding protein [Deltaproteobacteria bacterium]|nr:CoA-binding protein [Deltaproteobacteria bacterium]MBW2007710.1 CoA-binding protein [Deltaproteobacteria bacterium]
MPREHADMRAFFYPAAVAVFGVSEEPRNLARNIIHNCRSMGFEGDLYPVGKKPGEVQGMPILTDPEDLPRGVDLAVVLVPAPRVPEVFDACGRKGIRHAVVSTGGFREYEGAESRVEREVLSVASRHGIRFIGPNCIGVISTGSGLCTPFNPLDTGRFQKGPVGVISQSGGVTTQAAYTFSDEHVGFSNIISAGNKLDIDEIDLLSFLLQDEETEQVHLYLESIERGRDFLRLVREAPKPVVLLKANVGRTASAVARSHTAALFNDDRVVQAAVRQVGVVRVETIHDMTVAAKALTLPALRGNRLAAVSFSGGFSVILADACEREGFVCPPLPRDLVRKIEGYRRGGVIRMSNPMDLGDVHDPMGVVFALEACLGLDSIDGMALSMIYDEQMSRLFGGRGASKEQILSFAAGLSERFEKPVALSFFTEKRHVEDFKALGKYPVFNDAVESVRALRMLRDYWVRRGEGSAGAQGGM